MIQLADSHCHIHFSEYDYDIKKTLADARDAGVVHIVAVSTDLKTSRESIKFADEHSDVTALVGIHPHEAKEALARNEFTEFEKLVKENLQNISGIGECGLDYYYEHSPRDDQKKLLKMQLELAIAYDLPVSFHVRGAFDDFWEVLSKFKKVRGVVHSFSSSQKDMDAIIGYGLYVGINGIITFSREEEMLEAIRQAPLEKMLLETDAPYLSPKPYRGKINKPEYVGLVAKFLSDLKRVDVEQVANITLRNTKELFGNTKDVLQ